MTERSFEISCDVCGAIEWVHENLGDTMRSFWEKSGWRRKRRRAICPGCWEDGRRWDEATLFDAEAGTTAPVSRAPRAREDSETGKELPTKRRHGFARSASRHAARNGE